MSEVRGQKTEVGTDTGDEDEGGTEVLGGQDFPAPSKLPRDGRHIDYPEEFEVTWSVYPDRTGGNPKKKAYRAWRARVKQGVEPRDLYEGVKRYRAYLIHEGKIGSRYVLQAATFFGPDEHWREDWKPDDMSDADREMFRRRSRMDGWKLNGGDDGE